VFNTLKFKHTGHLITHIKIVLSFGMETVKCA